MKNWGKVFVLGVLSALTCVVFMAAGVNGIFNSVNVTTGYQLNGTAPSGESLCGDGTYFDTACVFYYQFVRSNSTALPQRTALNFSTLFTLTDSVSPNWTNVGMNAPGTGTYVATYTASPGTSTAAAVFDGNGNIKPSTSTAVDYYFSFTGCSIVNSGNLNSCSAIINFTTSTTPTFAAMPDANYQALCQVDTGSQSSASISLGSPNTSSTPSFNRSPSAFQYVWTEVMSNSADGSSAPQIDCHLHHN